MAGTQVSFQTQTWGKWILAGEHAVLRGSPALVFPLKSRALTLNFEPGPQPLALNLIGESGAELEPLFWAVLERACDLMHMPRSLVTGRLTIESAIPIGAGLGASAAFCVAMTRWFRHVGWLKTEDVYEFARTLENLFHGESSGVDIAVALSGEGLHFERSGRKFALIPEWSPIWSISYTGQKGVTSEAVQKVKQLHLRDPERGQRLDEEMRQAVEQCESALLSSRDEGLPQLTHAIQKASACFQAWGLTEGAVDQHMRQLKEAGALAVKPTGSGGGGYVLALWAEKPSADVSRQLIFC
jgi:mevalonate kinase